jgi:hypothetical protein
VPLAAASGPARARAAAAAAAAASMPPLLLHALLPRLLPAACAPNSQPLQREGPGSPPATAAAALPLLLRLLLLLLATPTTALPLLLPLLRAPILHDSEDAAGRLPGKPGHAGERVREAVPGRAALPRLLVAAPLLPSGMLQPAEAATRAWLLQLGAWVEGGGGACGVRRGAQAHVAPAALELPVGSDLDQPRSGQGRDLQLGCCREGQCGSNLAGRPPPSRAARATQRSRQRASTPRPWPRPLPSPRTYGRRAQQDVGELQRREAALQRVRGVVDQVRAGVVRAPGQEGVLRAAPAPSGAACCELRAASSWRGWPRCGAPGRCGPKGCGAWLGGGAARGQTPAPGAIGARAGCPAGAGGPWGPPARPPA